MGYGARAQRVPAKAKKNITDVDFYKLCLIGNFARGLSSIQRGMYSLDELEERLGGFRSGAYAHYVAKAFFETLESGVNVEIIARSYVASDAVQAAGTLMDGATPAVKAFDIKAGYKGAVDKSAYGNTIGYKVTKPANFTFKLASIMGINATSAVLTGGCEHLKPGYFLKIVDSDDGEDTFVKILTVNEATQTVTFAAAGNAATCAVATTTVTRLDWSLFIYLQSDTGQLTLKESWENYPMYSGNTYGLAAAVNDTVTGSKYVTLAWNTASTTIPEFVQPAAVSTVTLLTTGANGTAAVDSNWDTLADELKGEDVTIMLCPESSSSTHNENFLDVASDNLNWVYYGQAASGATESTLKELGLALRRDFRFGMIPCDKWIEVEDPLTAGVLNIPPVGHAAAHYFNSYARNGIKKVAAGNKEVVNTSDKLDESNGLVHDDVAGAGERMIKNYGINIARYRSGVGLTINSARTLSANLGYIYQNQIMGFLLVKKSIKAYLQLIEQDPSGIDAQQSHYNAVYRYLKNLYDEGAFYKGEFDDGTPTGFGDVVTIINDFSVNSLADIAAGKESIFCQVVFVPPIEEPILDLASADTTTLVRQ